MAFLALTERTAGTSVISPEVVAPIIVLVALVLMGGRKAADFDRSPVD